jgi:ESS family glutamate:Na+ symporter
MSAAVTVGPYMSLTAGMIVYFAGAAITRRSALLRDYSIPEAVTGGVLAALVSWAFYAAAGRALAFDLYPRDVLLVIFFVTIGLNARFADLAAGGRPLVVLAALTVAYILLQNAVALGGVTALGLPAAMGPLFGSAALVGGHGTVAAWGPLIAAEHGVPGALEAGIATATLGLVLASFVGGPVSRWLIERDRLEPAPDGGHHVVGLSFEEEARPSIDYVSVMRVLLTINIVAIAGYHAHQWITAQGVRLPLFVPCLLLGVAVANLQPLLAPRVATVARTPALALVSEFALSVFLAMSLMTMQLWTLAAVAGPLVLIVGAQALATTVFAGFAVYPALGRDYRAAVLSGGFVGFGLGATPTAIATMTAVTKHYGPSPTAFIVLPLVSAFLVDLANAAAIKFFLTF